MITFTITSPASTRLDKGVLNTSSRRLAQDEFVRLSFMSSEDLSRRLQDLLVKTNIFVLAICLQDVFKRFPRRLAKASSRRFEDVFKKSSGHLQDVLRRLLQDVFKTF